MHRFNVCTAYHCDQRGLCGFQVYWAFLALKRHSSIVYGLYYSTSDMTITLREALKGFQVDSGARPLEPERIRP
jgi:hypothetical protein